jgi:hypothetical protein
MLTYTWSPVDIQTHPSPSDEGSLRTTLDSQPVLAVQRQTTVGDSLRWVPLNHVSRRDFKTHRHNISKNLQAIFEDAATILDTPLRTARLDADKRQCPICLEEKTKSDIVNSDTCSHGVCWSCYGRAFKANRPVMNCPLCRAVFTLTSNESDYDDSSDDEQEEDEESREDEDFDILSSVLENYDGSFDSSTMLDILASDASPSDMVALLTSSQEDGAAEVVQDTAEVVQNTAVVADEDHQESYEEEEHKEEKKNEEGDSTQHQSVNNSETRFVLCQEVAVLHPLMEEDTTAVVDYGDDPFEAELQRMDERKRRVEAHAQIERDRLFALELQQEDEIEEEDEEEEVDEEDHDFANRYDEKYGDIQQIAGTRDEHETHTTESKSNVDALTGIRVPSPSTIFGVSNWSYSILGEELTAPMLCLSPKTTIRKNVQRHVHFEFDHESLKKPKPSTVALFCTGDSVLISSIKSAEEMDEEEKEFFSCFNE